MDEARMTKECFNDLMTEWMPERQRQPYLIIRASFVIRASSWRLPRLCRSERPAGIELGAEVVPLFAVVGSLGALDHLADPFVHAAETLGHQRGDDVGDLVGG